MILCACMIQEGQLDQSLKEQLEHSLSAVATRFFNVQAAVVWTEVSVGDGWTAGEPSTSSIVVMYVPPGLTQDERTDLLKAICDTWMEHTGCSIGEIVATARDLAA